MCVDTKTQGDHECLKITLWQDMFLASPPMISAHLTWASISLRSASLYRGRYLCRIRRAYCLKMAVMYTVLSTAETGFLKMPYTKITPSSEVVPEDRKQTLRLYKQADSHVFFRLLVTHLKPLCYRLSLSLNILLWLLLGLWAVLHQQAISCSLSLSQGERFTSRSLQSICYWSCFQWKVAFSFGKIKLYHNKDQR